MEVSVKSMHKLLLNVCEKTGIADSDTLLFDSSEIVFHVSSTRVTVALGRDASNRQVWKVQGVYDTIDLRNNGYMSVDETVGSFAVGDEASAVRAAVMRILEGIVDSAIDEASVPVR